MTRNQIKDKNRKFYLNREIIKKFLINEEIFFITYILEEDIIIMKKNIFKGKKGIWVIFKELNEKEKYELAKYTTYQLEKQLKIFIAKKIKKKYLGEKTSNIFERFSRENLDNKGMEKGNNIKEIIFLPSLIEILY